MVCASLAAAVSLRRARLRQLVVEEAAIDPCRRAGGGDGARGLVLALRDGRRAARFVQTRLADEALLEELLLPRGVALDVPVVRLGLHQLLPRRNRRHVAPLRYPRGGRLLGGHGLGERRSELGALELDQQLAGLDAVAFVDAHRLHPTGDRRADVHARRREDATADDDRLRQRGGSRRHDIHRRALPREHGPCGERERGERYRVERGTGQAGKGHDREREGRARDSPRIGDDCRALRVTGLSST